jgi:hypothetical protein
MKCGWWRKKPYAASSRALKATTRCSSMAQGRWIWAPSGRPEPCCRPQASEWTTEQQ